MAKPIIKEIIPFDATESFMVEFSWTGNMAYNNHMIIYDAETLVPLYDNTYPGRYYRLDHEIPAGTLQNGGKYAVTISVLDMNGTESVASDKYYFLTLATPTFNFTNVADGDELNNAVFTANVEYTQANHEPLASYQFHLYNDVQNLVYSSDVMYDVNNITYTYKDLANATDYYFQCTGITKKNIPVDTGMIHVTTYYQNPSIYARIYAENDDMTGFIHYRSNIVVIEPDEDDYELDESYVNLLDKPIRYTKDYAIPKDATIAIRMKDCNKATEFMLCKNGDDPVYSLYSLKNEDDYSIRFVLRVFGDPSDYVQYSIPYSIKSYDIVTIFIRRINGLYGMYIMVDEQDPIVRRNIWYQENRPNNGERTDLWVDTDYGVYIPKDLYNQMYQDNEPTGVDTYTIWIGGNGS